MLYARPDLMHRMLAINAEAVAAYLNAQIDAGAQAVMVFDSWGGVLADGAFQRFSLRLHAPRGGGTAARGRRPHRAGDRLHQGRRACGWRRSPTCGADVVGLDWTVNLGRARAQVGSRVALQGNLDPNVLFAPPEAVAREAVAVLDSFGPPQRADGGWDGHVFNLGHGISQFTPPEHVSALVEAVHSHSRRQRGGE
jgi:uroporphyrinogen decarboxylase